MSLWAARGLRIGCIVAVTAIVVTCVQTETDRCADDSVCPENTACRVLEQDPKLTTCVTDQQLATCEGSADLTLCDLGTISGTCFGGACYPKSCGDQIRDFTEACDDGNRESNDGCSASCDSFERCGDGLIDLLRREQCDDGISGLSGDGCSSTCLTELDLWQHVITGRPAPRVGMAVATDPARGVMLFGGTLGSGAGSSTAPPIADTWRWNETAWRTMTPPEQKPPARSYAAVGFDPLRKRVVMFGGTASTALGDLWEWNGISWTERTPAASPPPRERANMACSPSRCVLVGGRSGAMIRDDVWIWDGSTWTPMTGTLPGARFHAAMAYDSVRDVIVLFGGQGPSGNLTDTWELGTTWTERTLVGPPVSGTPKAAYDPALRTVVLTMPGQTWTYDGTVWFNTTKPSLVAGELAFDPSTGRVTSVTTQGQVLTWSGSAWVMSPESEPSASNVVLAAFDPANGRTILHDGSGTFGWDGVTWSVLARSPAPLPASAAYAAFVFDQACGQAVQVGGGNGSAARRDTWTFDGTWRLYPDTLLVPRSRHAMTYDIARDTVVLFGGLGANSAALGDTWEWTGPCNARVWTRRVLALEPSPRSGAVMAYDPVRRVTVMFGGVIDGAVTDETWEWDGAQWRVVPPGPRPPARSEHALAYDPRRHAVILFGGTNGATLLSDTWRWDGVAWTEIGTLVSAPARVEMTLAEDVTGNLITVGGRPITALQVWRLASSTAFESSESCRIASVDSDGDGLSGCADPDCGTRCRPLCPLGESCAGPHCGDGVCSVIEDYLLCPADCPPP